MKHLRTYHSYILKRTGLLVLVFLVMQLLLRGAFLILEANNISLSFSETLAMLGMGFVYDLATFSYFLIPYVLYLVILPKRLHLGRFDRLMTGLTYAALVYLMLFDLAAEWVFWDEFNVRFNFIAVDYLVYTQEVLANIWESYPIIPILSGLAVLCLGVVFLTKHWLLPHDRRYVTELKTRALYAALYLLIPAAGYISLDLQKAEISENNYANEITKNGVYSLFSAFLDDKIDYTGLYLSDYNNEPLPAIRDLLEEEESGQKFVTNDAEDITRFVPGKGKEKHKNVIIITMESMSADYMQHFGNKEGLTPNLDALADESLFFNNTFATGTRTIRGLEAITLSIPPTPGRSILKRENNENLASIGFVFKDRGYDTKFIYGGYGYFDNMNYFFEHNGFAIVDRNNFDSSEQTFANAWGLCDEDLFKKVIREADNSYQHHTPFMDVVMTTSNHRPYTFPVNEAGIPVEGGGRTAGVKYADYAIGKFLEKAKKKPWFKDTVFIFVADHTAGSAGKAELTLEKYHIPLIMYAPGFLTARTVANLTSQIDIAPILLGLLDFSYYSRFYGENILEDPDEQAHAFIANYQKLGFITGDSLVILKPGKQIVEYTNGKTVVHQAVDETLLNETIAYYKHAANWREHINKLETTVR
jgi:phosphoglycerol transferase MdoB-like AlkP superfamily enzyme